MASRQTGPPVAPVARSRRRRWLHRAGESAAVLVALVVGLTLLLPLIVRGPVLRHLIRHGSESMCGSISLADGHVGWAAVPNLLHGRPVTVTMGQVQIRTPDGHEVLAAARVTASIEIHVRPLRLVINDAVVDHGHVELAIAEAGRPPRLVEALQTVPAAGPQACLGASTGATATRPDLGAPSKGSSGSRVALDVRHLRLRDVDLDLELLFGALSLAGLDADGSFSLPASAVILFDASNAIARRGGFLRIGKTGTAAAVRLPIDQVTLGRLAVTPEAPTDLLVEIAAASTGRSRLNARAVLHDIMNAPRAATSGQPPHPALDVDTHWEQMGDAIAAMEAQWLPPKARRPRIEGRFEASLRGPFEAPVGKLRTDIGPLHVTAELEDTGNFDTDLRIDGVDTNPFLEPALRPSLGGHLEGHVRLHAHLAPTQADRSIVLREADVRLDRSHGGPWLRHLRVRVGSPARAKATAGHVDRTALLTLAGARLDGPTLRLEGVDIGREPFHVHGSVVARLPDDQARSTTSFALAGIKAHFDVDVPSLARLFPELPLRGAVHLGLLLEGNPDRLTTRVAFRGRPTISIWGQGFTPPAQVTASLLGGEILTIPPIVVTHVGGGSVDADARLKLDRTAVKASLHVRDFPVSDLPGLEHVKLPSFLASTSKSGATLRDALRGRLNGAVLLQGALARPAVDGELTIGNARLAGRSLGDGRLRIHALIDQLTFDGALGPSVAFDGRMLRGARGMTSSGAATVRLRDLRLRPWLPAPWAAMDISASGEVTASVAEPNPPELWGSVRLGSTGGTLEVDGRVTARRAVDSLEDASLEVALKGQLDAAALADPLRRIGRPSGHVDVSAKITGTVAEPTIEGDLHLDARLRPVRRGLPELHVAGAVEMRGQTVSTRGLRIDIADVGPLSIGRTDHPATLELGPLWPPTLWRIDLPVSAYRLGFKQPTSPISIEGLSLELRLVGQLGGDLIVRGEVDLAHAAYDLGGPAVKPEAKPKPKPKPAGHTSHRPWYESLPPRLTLDLTLRGPQHAMTVEIPYAPDVTIDLECHLFATSRGATLSGRLQGDTAFSRAAVAVLDWLKPADIRACQLLSL